MEYGYGDANILDIYPNIIRDMIFSIKNRFFYAGEYLRKNRKESKVKHLLEKIENLSDKEKKEIVSEILTFIPEKSDIYSFNESYENFNEWNKKESKFKELFDDIEKKFDSLTDKEKHDLLKITFYNINSGIYSLRNALSENIMEVDDIEFLFVIDQALQVCYSLSNNIIKNINKKQTTDSKAKITRSVMFLLILLMRIESIRRGESDINKLYSDISLTLFILDLNKIEIKGEYKITENDIDNRVYNVVEA